MNDVSIIKAHRHFDLDPNEAMLEKPVGDDGSSETSPVLLKDIFEQKEEHMFYFSFNPIKIKMPLPFKA